VNIIQDFIPAGRRNRPMTNPSSSLYRKTAKLEWITIHNAASQARAERLHQYVKSEGAASRPASWHFSIDEKDCYQALPLTESGWHAGDNLGPGNTRSVGIEICDYAMLQSPRNESLYLQAEDHTAQLCAWLIQNLSTLRKYPDCLKQHFDWSGKNCPRWIRQRQGGWQQFVDRVGEYLQEPDEPDLPEEPDVWFRVVAGSYRDRENAELMRGNLRRQGIPAFLAIHRG